MKLATTVARSLQAGMQAELRGIERVLRNSSAGPFGSSGAGCGR